MSSATALLSRLAAQVRIDPRPIPKNLHESRQILLALQKFGEVVAFRNLKYDISNNKPNNDERSILAILDSAEAAQHAILASPITVTIPKPANTSANSSLSSPTPLSTSPSDSDTKPTTITCEIKPSTHNHERTLTRNPFHSPYVIDQDTPIYADMTSPETAVPLKELADVLQRPKKPIPYAVKRQIQRSTARMGGHSLRELWQEGLVNAEVEKLRGEREEKKNAKTGLRRVSLGRMRASGGVGVEDDR